MNPSKYTSSPHPAGLAGMLSPISCRLSAIEQGWELRTSGVDMRDLLGMVVVTCETNRSSTLLLQDAVDSSPPQTKDVHSDGMLLDMPPPPRLKWAIRVDGPLEPEDIDALEQACRSGTCPLASEPRTVSAVRELDGGGTSIRARSRDQLLLVAAHILRSHVKGSIRPRVQDVTHPEVDFMHNLMDRSGAFNLRSIETDVYSTWIDVGLSTRPEPGLQPANQSVIFDFISGTWHGDF